MNPGRNIKLLLYALLFCIIYTLLLLVFFLVILPLLTALVKSVFPDFGASQTCFSMLVCTPIPLIAYLCVLAYGKVKRFSMRKKMAGVAAKFSPDKIDCYVAVRGKFRGEKTCITPFSKEKCAFLSTEIFAEWETRQPKPKSGMDQHRKPLLRQKTAEHIEIVTDNGSIWVDMGVFRPPALELRKNEFREHVCPEPIRKMAQAKYKTYHVIERYICDNDWIKAHGRVARFPDGRLFLCPTELLEYPSFVSVYTSGTGRRRQQIIADAHGTVRKSQIQIADGIVMVAILLFVAVMGNLDGIMSTLQYIIE